MFTKARLKEADPEAMQSIEKIKTDSGMMEPEVAHEEVPLGHAARMPVGEPRKRRRDRNLDARRRRKQQERTQNKDGCRKDLVANRKGTTRRARVVWRKRNILRKSWTQRNCGLRKEVTAAGIKVSRRAGVARCKSNFVRKYPTRDIVEQEIPKRRRKINAGKVRNVKMA
jgi:hypothetical protein